MTSFTVVEAIPPSQRKILFPQQHLFVLCLTLLDLHWPQHAYSLIPQAFAMNPYRIGYELYLSALFLVNSHKRANECY